MGGIFPFSLPPLKEITLSCLKNLPGWFSRPFPGCPTPTGTAEVTLKHAVVWARVIPEAWPGPRWLLSGLWQSAHTERAHRSQPRGAGREDTRGGGLCDVGGTEGVFTRPLCSAMAERTACGSLELRSAQKESHTCRRGEATSRGPSSTGDLGRK